MSMEADGPAAGLLGAADTSLAMSMDQRLGYRIAEGPTPDTTAVTVTYRILDGGGTMTAMGQTEFITFDDLAADFEMPPVEIVLDPAGNLVEAAVGGEPLPAEFLEAFGGLGSADMLQQPHLGPIFPDHPVAVGEEWRVDLSQQAMGFDIRQEGRFRVTGEEFVDGIPVLRIEGTIVTDEFSVTMDEIMSALAGYNGGDPDVEAGMEMFGTLGIDVDYTIERSEMDLTSWFDPLEGIVVRAEFEIPMTTTMNMSGMPDIGDITMGLHMEVFQTLALASPAFG
jgi:hypothetical protein